MQERREVRIVVLLPIDGATSGEVSRGGGGELGDLGRDHGAA